MEIQSVTSDKCCVLLLYGTQEKKTDFLNKIQEQFGPV